MSNPHPASHRTLGKYTHAAHAAEWQALAAEINAFRGGLTLPAIAWSGTHPASLQALADAMGMPNSLSTLRNMLHGRRRSDRDGAVIPGPDKIAAARAWLKIAQRK